MANAPAPLPPLEALHDWYVVAQCGECYIEALFTQLSERTGKPSARVCTIRYSEGAAPTLYGRWTILVATRYQAHRAKKRKPRDAAEFRFIRDFVSTALANVSEGDLLVWSAGESLPLAELRTKLLSELPPGLNS